MDDTVYLDTDWSRSISVKVSYGR